MRNILSKLELSYSFLIVALGFVLTGHFSNLLIFTSLIIVHEFGHVVSSLFFGYKLNKIIIYPYGGYTKFDMIINTDINKDLIIAISGIIFQSIYFIIIYYLYSEGIVREYIFNLFSLYNRSMLVFNLLPIVPLDGYKIVNLILSKYFNYNFVNNMTVVISLLCILFVLYSGIYENNYSFVLILGVLFKSIYDFYKNIGYIYNRFLLERYLYDIKYKRISFIDDKGKMYKNRLHYFIANKGVIPEKVYLRSFFRKKD